MTPLEIALDAIQRGWSPIPIRRGAKGGGIAGWQNLRITAADAARHFKDDYNVGVLMGTPSNGLTDIDLDCLEACAVAASFLPATGAVYGRKSNPASHYLFYTELGAENCVSEISVNDRHWAKLAKGNKARVLELRTGAHRQFDDPADPSKKAGEYIGKQSVLPGSIHTSGEPYRWERGKDGEPSRINGDALTAAFYKVAAYSLLLRYFPLPERPGEHTHGGNEAAGAIGGMLAREGMPVEDVAALMRVIGGFCEINRIDRENFTSAALRGYNRTNNGEPMTGRPRLAEIMGEAPLKEVEKCFAFIRIIERTPKPKIGKPKPARRAAPPAESKESESAGTPDDDLLILDRDDPNMSAKALIASKFKNENGQRTLLHYQDTFYIWRKSRYEELPKEQMVGIVWQFLDGAMHMTKNGPDRFKPNTTRCNDVMRAAATQSQLRGKKEFPHWSRHVNAVAPAEEMLACSNGLLHIPTRKLFPLTPGFRNVFAVDYNYDEHALPSNLWINFLNQLWPGDQQSIETLQEMFGLFLTNDTSYQKAFMIVGPPRSGKGTITRVLQRLLGKDHIAATTLSALGETFGKQPLLNKTVAIMSDVRIDGRSDLQSVSESLLSITGEDTVPVNRKNMTTVMEQLKVRFLLTTNTVPRLPDSSEALTKRFIMMQLLNSFYEKEDKALSAKLTEERGMSGLLNWALDGLRRLNARGYFVQPTSAETSSKMFREASNPVGEFVKENCVVKDDAECSCKDLYTVYTAWCEEEGIRNRGTSQGLGVALHAMLPRCHTRRAGGRDDRHKQYVGIALNTRGTDRLKACQDHAARKNSDVVPFTTREF